MLILTFTSCVIVNRMPNFSSSGFSSSVIRSKWDNCLIDPHCWSSVGCYHYYHYYYWARSANSLNSFIVSGWCRKEGRWVLPVEDRELCLTTQVDYYCLVMSWNNWDFGGKYQFIVLVPIVAGVAWGGTVIPKGEAVLLITCPRTLGPLVFLSSLATSAYPYRVFHIYTLYFCFCYET